jgi:hypothetical protein
MPRNEKLEVPRGNPVELTTADTNYIRVQNTGEVTVRLVAAVGPAAPDFDLAPIDLNPTQAIFLELDKMWPGISGANRLYADCDQVYGQVSVSHA